MPDQRLEYIASNLDAMKIGLDETFRFHCTMCGKCCTGREDILLSMSKELDLSAGELFQKYCEAYFCRPVPALRHGGCIYAAV